MDDIGVGEARYREAQLLSRSVSPAIPRECNRVIVRLTAIDLHHDTVLHEEVNTAYVVEAHLAAE